MGLGPNWGRACVFMYSDVKFTERRAEWCASEHEPDIRPPQKQNKTKNDFDHGFDSVYCSFDLRGTSFERVRLVCLPTAPPGVNPIALGTGVRSWGGQESMHRIESCIFLCVSFWRQNTESDVREGRGVKLECWTKD